MSDVLKLKKNVTEIVSFTYRTGKEVSGIDGPQYMWRLQDGRVTFVSPVVNQGLLSASPQIGEKLAVTVRDGGLEVRRVDPTGERGFEAPLSSHAKESNNGNGNTNGHDRQATLTQLGNVLVNGTPNPQPVPAGLMTGQSQFCLQQLIATIDMVHAAEKYALAMNRPVTFSSEDIRAMAISCFISQSRQQQGGR